MTDFRLEDGTRTEPFLIDTRTGVCCAGRSYTRGGRNPGLGPPDQPDQYDRQAPDELFSLRSGNPTVCPGLFRRAHSTAGNRTPQPGKEAQTPQAGEFYFTHQRFAGPGSQPGAPARRLPVGEQSPARSRRHPGLPEPGHHGAFAGVVLRTQCGPVGRGRANSQETARLVRSTRRRPAGPRWRVSVSLRPGVVPGWQPDCPCAPARMAWKTSSCCARMDRTCKT